jgi:hypothetical protein
LHVFYGNVLHRIAHDTGECPLSVFFAGHGLTN